MRENYNIIVKITDHSKLLKLIMNKYTPDSQTYSPETEPENCRLFHLLTHWLFYPGHKQRSRLWLRKWRLPLLLLTLAPQEPSSLWVTFLTVVTNTSRRGICFVSSLTVKSPRRREGDGAVVRAAAMQHLHQEAEGKAMLSYFLPFCSFWKPPHGMVPQILRAVLPPQLTQSRSRLPDIRRCLFPGVQTPPQDSQC